MKILIVVANFGTKNDSYLSKVLAEYRTLPYEKDVIVVTNISKSLGEEVQVVVEEPPTSNPKSFPYLHRRLFTERADAYDLFIYTEDDILITRDHIESFLEVTQYLPENQVAGFLRYEIGKNNTVNIPDIHASFYWKPDSVKYYGPYTFAEFSNKHSGSYLLTRPQLQTAIKSGAYALKPEPSRYYGILESAASNPFHYCGLHKIICVSHIDRFLLHHLSNRFIGVLGISKEELDTQIKGLTKAARGEVPQCRLFETETKLNYRQFDKSYYPRRNPQILKAIGSRGKQDILSVGCGSGETEAALVKMGHRVVAIPLDEIIAVTARAQGIETVVPDFDRALESLCGQKFDFLIFQDVLQHLQAPKTWLARLTDFLKDKGEAIATFWNVKCRRFSVEQLIPINNMVAASETYEFDTLGIHWCDEQMIRTWFEQAGFELKHVAYPVPRGLRKYNWLSLGWQAKYLAPRLIVSAIRQN